MHSEETTLGDELLDVVTKETLIRQGLADRRPLIHRKTTSIVDHTSAIWSECETKPDEVAQTPKQIFPPWELTKPVFEHCYAEGTSKKSDPSLATTLAREKTEQRFSQHLKMYTDGSVLDSGEVGGIRGNELADRAARGATDEGTEATLPQTLSEVKNKIRRAALSQREEAPRVVRREQVPRTTYRRSHADTLQSSAESAHCCAHTRSNDFCQCGQPPDIRHIVNGCAGLPVSLHPIWDLRDRHSLKTADFLKSHQALGGRPMRIFADLTVRSDLAKWF
nr:hypothetical protein BaRGS_027425 [Batillaria attramentaria]